MYEEKKQYGFQKISFWAVPNNSIFLSTRTLLCGLSTLCILIVLIISRYTERWMAGSSTPSSKHWFLETVQQVWNS